MNHGRLKNTLVKRANSRFLLSSFSILVLSLMLTTSGCGKPASTPTTNKPSTAAAEKAAAEKVAAEKAAAEKAAAEKEAAEKEAAEKEAAEKEAAEKAAAEKAAAEKAAAETTTTEDEKAEAVVAMQPKEATDKKQALPVGIVKDKPSKGRFVQVEQGYMVPYTVTIPGTEVTFDMVPVPGGTFKMGSPDDEEERDEYEGPQVELAVEPFWIAKCEVTWGEYHQFMDLYEPLKVIQSKRNFFNPDDDIYEGKTEEQKAAIKKRVQESQAAMKADLQKYPDLKFHVENDPTEADAFTTPTPLYSADVTYEFGSESNLPAITITQYAAMQYTKWMSGITADSYRLPSEVEWEYAARAGTTTPFSFGEDAEDIDDYAWYADNSEETTHPVGEKKPNPWGLHDMHGNVAEWVLDAFEEDAYDKLAKQKKGNSILERVTWPKEEYPCILRGGGWDDYEDFCRSAKRIRSGTDWDDEDWKKQDPQIPKSPWWFTEKITMQVGFRIIRPLKPMNAKEKNRSWETQANDILQNIEGKLQEGRGVQGKADKKLPNAIKEAGEYEEE